MFCAVKSFLPDSVDGNNIEKKKEILYEIPQDFSGTAS
jgi:hypothetical protein